MTDFDGVTRWYTAEPRGVIPLDTFHIPKTLGQVVRQKRFDVRINHDFRATMIACMNSLRRESDGTTHSSTWISDKLIDAYCALHELGHAHSVESWQNGRLVGGLYGVSVGGAFFGESMFHSIRDASKVALVHLVERMRDRGFVLLDTQAQNRHLMKFGCVEIPLDQYIKRLHRATQVETSFDP